MARPRRANTFSGEGRRFYTHFYCATRVCLHCQNTELSYFKQGLSFLRSASYLPLLNSFPDFAHALPWHPASLWLPLFLFSFLAIFCLSLEVRVVGCRRRLRPPPPLGFCRRREGAYSWFSVFFLVVSSRPPPGVCCVRRS